MDVGKSQDSDDSTTLRCNVKLLTHKTTDTADMVSHKLHLAQ
jgi:hypothetical protein